MDADHMYGNIGIGAWADELAALGPSRWTDNMHVVAVTLAQ
ncbi:MAG: hypothetical protein WCB67_11295 [Solirubrobacteraceae bacterium]